ncbi:MULTISPECIES: hypothetical protein [unclassified Streptomyces]|uniref:hypothetical protein n=1 Tax=Streptomyces TaxID=1883 RepID=UPI001EEFCAFF|nr:MULTISPECIES: hypothetical protein [unclassified Streptomyces]
MGHVGHMVSSQRKLVRLVTAAVLLGSGMTVTAAGSVAAAENVGAARACTVDAPRFTSYPGTGSNDPSYWPARGTWATTSTRCNDINLKLDEQRDVRTCFKSGSGWNCNRWRPVYGLQWGTAAEDVLHGTKFFLQFNGTGRAKGHIDY